MQAILIIFRPAPSGLGCLVAIFAVLILGAMAFDAVFADDPFEDVPTAETRDLIMESVNATALAKDPSTYCAQFTEDSLAWCRTDIGSSNENPIGYELQAVSMERVDGQILVETTRRFLGGPETTYFFCMVHQVDQWYITFGPDVALEGCANDV